MSNFQKLLKSRGLGTYSSEELNREIENRAATKNPFPLDVFNENIKPFINALSKHYDVPNSFIGLSLLSAYSTAIGTSYVVSTNHRDQIYLPVWAALVGMSSSGKSLAISNIYRPLETIQREFDFEWEEKTKGLSSDKINQTNLDTVIYRDAFIQTLVRSVLPDNPKGVVKMSDELIEWINGMNMLSRREGTDEQFWVSSWNGNKYSGIRSGKMKFVIHRPFVNIIGGVQYSILPRLFARDRDTTGFTFRLLFALPEFDKIAEPDPSFEMPKEWYTLHEKTITRLYRDLPVTSHEDNPKVCLPTPEAMKLYQGWTKVKTKKINSIEDPMEREIRSGIIGKIKEYALRFSAILHLADRAMERDYERDFFTAFCNEEYISASDMERALMLADYFYHSAVEVYARVQESNTAPPHVIIAANLLNREKSYADIAEALYDSRDDKYRMRVCREIKKWIKDYPRVFNAIPK